MSDNARKAACAKVDDIIADLRTRSRQSILSDKPDGFSMLIAFTADDLDSYIVLVGGDVAQHGNCLSSLIERMGKHEPEITKHAILRAVSDLADGGTQAKAVEQFSYAQRKRNEKE